MAKKPRLVRPVVLPIERFTSQKGLAAKKTLDESWKLAYEKHQELLGTPSKQKK